MNQFQMTESDKADFLSGEEGRGRIRAEAASSNPRAESIQIVDSEGLLFDTVQGIEFDGESEDTSPGLAVVLTDEQLDEKRMTEALLSADVARVEDELRPLVMAKLKEEAHSEVREEFRETVQQLRRENSELRDASRRLAEGTTSLARANEALRTENALLKAKVES